MDLIAKFPVELNGHIYRKGERLAYDGEITRRIAANFTTGGGEEIVLSTEKVERVKRTRKEALEV